MSFGKVFILGDSYSTFIGYIPESCSPWYIDGGHENTDVTCVEQTWWHKLIKETDSSLVLNSSYSGTTVCHTGYNGGDCSHISFIARFEKLAEENFFAENEVDTVFVFGGTNDSWAGSPVGELKYSDWSREDLYSVLPAYCYLINKIKTVLPKARIVSVINTELKPEITEGFSVASEKYGIEAVILKDIGKTAGHPNKTGMEQIKEQIIKII